MSQSSNSLGSGCSGASGSNSDHCGCSSLEGSVSLPRRIIHYNRTCNGKENFIEEEDCLWCSEYAQDIFSYLRRIENTRREIMYRSPQIYHRANLIELIKRIAEAEKLGRTTVHLAVYMLDVFMDTYKIVTSKLNLVVFVCLLLASKVEERDQNIPKISTLNGYFDCQYTRSDFKSLERMILNFFKWSLLVPTTATFVESFAHQAVISEEILESTSTFQSRYNDDSAIDLNESIKQNTIDTCNNLVFEFLELTLNERRLVHIKPSYLSAACIAAARKVCNITPIWSERLQSMTKCNYEIISDYVKALICLRNYLNSKSDKIKKTPDSGCITSDSESDSQGDDVYHCPIPFKRQRLIH